MPVGYARLLGNPRYNWMYRTDPEPHLGERVLEVPSGRGLGGTGLINGMIYVRGSHGDFDHWRSLGNPGWAFADVLPWFIRSEANTRFDDGFHGSRGPLTVSDPTDRQPLADAFVAAGVESGLRANDDFNGVRQSGVGAYQLNIRAGVRASTASSYLRAARGRPNLTVVSGALVDRIRFRGDCVSGVEYLRGGQRIRVDASREVVVAAGSFGSPGVLLRSGIGGADPLRELGIRLVADLPGVGSNLQNHFRSGIVLRCKQPVTLNDTMQSVVGRLGMAARYLARREGPLAVGTRVGGFLDSGVGPPVGGSIDRPDIQLTFWDYSVLRRGAQGVEFHPFSAFTTNVVLIRPDSRGSVRLTSRDPTAPPAIVFNHLAAEDDARRLIAALRQTRRLLGMPAMTPYAGDEIEPGPAAVDDASLEAQLRARGSSVFHPAGTCRMGTGPDAVVDATLRVRGVTGLRVADASVMPTLVAGNTQAATVMIAERAADWMLRDALAVFS